MSIKPSRLRGFVLSLPGGLRPKTVFCERRQQGQNPVPDLLDRLKTALADRYAIEHERAGGKALPKGQNTQ